MAENEYRGTLVSLGWSMMAVSTVVLGLRLWGRTGLIKKAGYDDWCMMGALVSAITTTALVTVGTGYGIGHHVVDIADPNDLAEAIKYTIIAPAVSLFASVLAKMSVVIFLMRLLGYAATVLHKSILYSATLIMIGANLFAVIIILGHCTPAQKTWIPTTPGTCMSNEILQYGGKAVGIYDAAVDFLCAIFPVFMLRSLAMKNRTKWGLAIVMGGGAFAGAATCVKVWMMSDVANVADITYAWAPIAVWYQAEMYVLIITGSLPTLRPVWKFVCVRMGMTSFSSAKGESYGMDYTPNQDSRSRGSKAGPITLAFRELEDEEIGLRSNDGSSEHTVPKDSARRNTASDQRIHVQVTREIEVTNSAGAGNSLDEEQRGLPYGGLFH